LPDRIRTVEAFLEELRSIAQLGLCYASDPHDKDRYERLMTLTCEEYAAIAELPVPDVKSRLAAEFGHVTPKVGVDAAIFDDAGRLLLTRRFDDGMWCLPCGWAELGETARDAIRREVREEVCLDVSVGEVIDVFSRLPGQYGPHTAYFVVFHCVRVTGEPTTTEEAVEIGYFYPDDIVEWHRDHEERARRAVRFRTERL